MEYETTLQERAEERDSAVMPRYRSMPRGREKETRKLEALEDEAMAHSEVDTVRSTHPATRADDRCWRPPQHKSVNKGTYALTRRRSAARCCDDTVTS